MADMQMKQAAPANDGAYVYAEAADGSLVKIPKSALIPLLGLSGTIIKKWTKYIDSGQTEVIENVQGLVYAKNGYAYGGYVLYLATFGQVVQIVNPVGYGNNIELSMEEVGKLIVKNTANAQRFIEIYYQSLDY